MAQAQGMTQPGFGARELQEGEVAQVYCAPHPATVWAGH